MGLLLDGRYWGKVSNDILDNRPVPGHGVPLDAAVATLNRACRAITDLAKDPELEKDLEFARRTVANGDRYLGEVRGFFEEFIRAEREILWQSGVNDATASEILYDIKNLGERLSSIDESIDVLKNKISSLADKVCRCARKEEKLMYDDRGRADFTNNVWSFIKGVTITAADGFAIAGLAGVTVASGGLTGLAAIATAIVVAPISLRYGTSMASDAIKAIGT